ncbi:HEAT repeat-containing protein [Trypanosoma grayi]|uniref:HEAT repeat-containing protein n=1 Tax=Trypanosoma grayi TaxID=71804 RepID=UPI0004F449AA|nr:HEAT repeat-containing protein [Trypanosoma grayi]KEG14820.1 HEAT repeat-containing protein [Trypanosoma grayi]
MLEPFISPQTLRLLVDSKAESRQKGGREVASRVAAVFRDSAPEEAYATIIQELREVEKVLIRATAAAYRRGGLGAVRAIAGSLPARTHSSEVIISLATLVFDSVADVDATVRLAAFEAAHTLVRQLQAQLLEVCFMQVLRGVACGINDHDMRVAMLAREVSSLLREIVTGNEPFALQTELFVTFITEILAPYISAINGGQLPDSPVVQWCLEWIHHVLDLPGDELILLLWRFLKQLLILSGTRCGSDVLWLMQKCLRDTKDAFCRNADVQLANLLAIAAECVEEVDIPATKKNALEWILELLMIDMDELLHLTHVVVGASLSQLGSKSLETRVAAQNVSNSLMQLIGTQEGGCKKVPYDAVLRVVTERFTEKGTEETRVAALEWIGLVHHADPNVMERRFTETFSSSLMLLCDRSAHVVHKCIETLCLISGETHFDYFVTRLIDLFHAKADVLLPKVPTIIKQLQLRYQDEDLGQCEKLCLKLAAVLALHEDKRFLEKVVITLSTMVLTSKEFLPLREILNRGVNDERARSTFLGLYRCWHYNTAATLGLCLLSRAYEHAFQLIQFMGNAEMSAGTLLQLERLAQLIEAPVFAFIRMALMEPSKCLPLVQTLFALQLILPQSSPHYTPLYHRLKTIPSLVRLEREAQAHTPEEKKDNCIAWGELLEHSREAQQCISDFEHRLFLQRLGDTSLS